MAKLTLKKEARLKDFQSYVDKMVKERGFDKHPIPQLFMLMLEECGEFAKAARKQEKLRIDSKSEDFKVAEEAADVFIYLLDICNRFGIDLEKAFREKEEMNKERIWK